MVRVSQESRDTQTRGVLPGGLYPPRDSPGMVRVSQESRDTQTRGVLPGGLYPSRDSPGMVRVSPGYSDKGGDQSIPRVSVYCDEGLVLSTLSSSQDHQGIILCPKWEYTCCWMYTSVFLRKSRLLRTSFKDYRHSAGLLDIPETPTFPLLRPQH